MGDVSGVTGAGPLWGAVMDRVTGGESVAFAGAEGLGRVPLCALSGRVAGPHCPISVDEWLENEGPGCDWHVAACEVDWPPAYSSWAAETDAGVGCRRSGPVEIASPGAGATYYIDPRLPAERQRVPLRASVPAGAQRAEWRVDGARVAVVSRPFEALWTPARAGMHRVELIVDGRSAAPVEVWIGGVENTVE